MTEFPEAAKRYRDFRQSCLSDIPPSSDRLAESPPPFSGSFTQVDELEVQARWFAGEYGREFVGSEGERIEIVQFGHWNHSAGPDFTECAVRIDHELKGGSIEVDHLPDYWEQHGHGANTAFDETVLHVCLKRPNSNAKFYTRTSQHRGVSQIFLGGLESFGDSPALRGTLPEAKRGRCATPLADLPLDRLDSLLEAAGQHRLEKKARRYRSIASTHNQSQALFQGVAEVLGYRHNKVAMAVLSQRLSIKLLVAKSESEREALLFGAAGFIGHEQFMEATSEVAKTYLKSLWDDWWKLRDQYLPDESRNLTWQLAGTRPTNHPQRRLGALAALSNDWAAFLRLIPDTSPSQDWVKPLRDYLAALAHPYWNHHYTLRSKHSVKPLALIGKDRIHDLLGNILFPKVIGEHPSEWTRYAKLPGSLVNEKLRRAAIRLFGDPKHPLAKHALKTFANQQALLQIYADFCLEDLSECATCPFPEQLAQW